MKKHLLSLATVAFGINASAGNYDDGSLAIAKDSSIIKSWATGIELHRGPIDLSDPFVVDKDTNLASFGHYSNALGAVSGPTTEVVSLGDGGWATLSFKNPIVNGEGPDFAVFENAIAFSGLHYGELAFVEVSSDGERFVRFPAHSLTQTVNQLGGFDAFDPTDLHNLAGKDLAGFGTPFDLQELTDSAGLDVNNIRFVRIVDVVGSIDPNYATYDSFGNIINDPWSTPFWSSGFDLDGVAVLNEADEFNQIINFSDVDLADGGFFTGTTTDGDSSFISGLLSFNYSNSGWWSGFGASNTQDDTTAGFLNDKSAITASGMDSVGDAYGIANGTLNSAVFTNGGAHVVSGMYVTNATYAALSMQTGDFFAKAFGGATGNDEDYFKLTVWGTQLNGEATTDSVDFYLADFRFADNDSDYIVTNWRWVDLQVLGAVTGLNFKLSSTDNGSGGMNTPAYFMVDNITVKEDLAPEPNFDFDKIVVELGTLDSVIDISNWFSDTDNDDALIEYELISASDFLFDAVIANQEVVLTFVADTVGADDLVIRVKSNGQTVEEIISVEVVADVSLDDLFTNAKVYPNPTSAGVIISGLPNSTSVDVEVFASSGQLLKVFRGVHDGSFIDLSVYSPGIYQLKIDSHIETVIVK